MTKKDYVCPAIALEMIDAAELICTSDHVTSDVGITYGGVDEEGTKTVESRRFSVWEEDL